MTTVVETFYAIDFDRCLSDTPKLDKVFYQLASEHAQLDADELLKARNAIEDQGVSFNQMGALKKILTDSEIDEFFETFITRALEHDILSTGARKLLSVLKERSIPFGIVSYGDSSWQSIKIRASGVDKIPALITDHKRKGEIVASWQQSDGSFLIPTELTNDHTVHHVKSVVLLDDKADAFIGLPETARGYWVQSVTGKLLPSQDGTIPQNVRIARGLDQVITLESL